jgi:ribosomal protein S18 acetylase RimI-like enzyme
VDEAVGVKIVYRVNAPITGRQLAQIFSASGLRRPVKDPRRISKMREHANLTITAWDGKELVGVARALTDFAFCCYVSDLGVHADYQRRGIGRRMLQLIRQKLGDEVMILLLSAPEAMAYYPRVGFVKVENAWKIARAR